MVHFKNSCPESASVLRQHGPAVECLTTCLSRDKFLDKGRVPPGHAAAAIIVGTEILQERETQLSETTFETLG
jgi:hypothetical protein